MRYNDGRPYPDLLAQATPPVPGGGRHLSPGPSRRPAVVAVERGERRTDTATARRHKACGYNGRSTPAARRDERLSRGDERLSRGDERQSRSGERSYSLSSTIWLTMTVLLILGGGVCHAAPVAMTGWTVPASATVGAELRLNGSGEGAAAWAISPPVADMQRGKPCALKFAVHGGTAGEQIALALVSGEGAAPKALWRWVLPGGNKDHQVRLQVISGLNAPKLAFAYQGADGTVTLSQISVEAAEIKVAHQKDTTPFGEVVPKAETLPANWDPKGNLDARVRQLADEKEMIVDVGGLEVGIPGDISTTRGERASVAAFVMNRGDVDKELTTMTVGPPQVPIEIRTVKVPAKKTTQFHAFVQCLTSGDVWAKMVFSCEGQSGAAPVLLHCTPCYPAFGAQWPDATQAPSAMALAALAALPTQMNLVALPADPGTVAAWLRPFTAGPAGLAVQTPAGGDAGAVAGAAAKAWPGIQAYVPPLAGEKAEFGVVSEIAAGRKAAGGSGFVASPVYDLATDGDEDAASPALIAALGAGLGENAACIAVRGRPEPDAAVLVEEIDGKTPDAPNLGWAQVDAAGDLGALRGTLADKGAQLPILLTDVGGVGTGDARLDALLLARRMASACYRGSTGVMVRAQAKGDGIGLVKETGEAVGPMCEAMRELSRELAGAVPVAAFASKAGFSGVRDAPVVYKSFLRDREGIIVMWNNTGVPQDVAVEVRSEPLAGTLLKLSYTGEFVQRKSDGMFNYSQDAVDRRQRAVYVTLNPLQVVCLSLSLSDPHAGWLSAITTRGPIVPKNTRVEDAQTWWDDYVKNH